VNVAHVYTVMTVPLSLKKNTISVNADSFGMVHRKGTYIMANFSVVFICASIAAARSAAEAAIVCPSTLRATIN